MDSSRSKPGKARPDPNPGDWVLYVVCPQCQDETPYAPLPGYDPKNPVLTGVRVGIGERLRQCRACRKAFQWTAAQGVPRQVPARSPRE
jgi:hypothetical protein